MPWDMSGDRRCDADGPARPARRSRARPREDRGAGQAGRWRQGAEIWIGGGAVDAGPEILALAEKIGAPVVSFRMGKGVVDSRHPRRSHGRRLELWDKTDLLIGIGTRLDVPIAPLGAGAPAEDGANRYRPGRASPSHRQRGDPWPMRPRDAGSYRRGEEQQRSRAPRRRDLRQGGSAGCDRKADPQYSFMKVLRDVLPDDGIVVDGHAARLHHLVRLSGSPPRAWFLGFPVRWLRLPDGRGRQGGQPDRRWCRSPAMAASCFGGSDLATASSFGINLVTWFW